MASQCNDLYNYSALVFTFWTEFHRTDKHISGGQVACPNKKLKSGARQKCLWNFLGLIELLTKMASR